MFRRIRGFAAPLLSSAPLFPPLLFSTRPNAAGRAKHSAAQGIRLHEALGGAVRRTPHARLYVFGYRTHAYMYIVVHSPTESNPTLR